MKNNCIADEAGDVWLVKWEDNEDGPDERMIEEGNDFFPVIKEMAMRDDDATMKVLR